MQLGYDPAAQPDRLQITTGSGVEFVPRVSVSKFVALDQARTAFPVLGHTLPPSAGVDGLLGLDFFRELELIVNFRTGQISLNWKRPPAANKTLHPSGYSPGLLLRSFRAPPSLRASGGRGACR